MGEPDEVPDHQEVTGEVHPPDDLQLEVHAPHDLAPGFVQRRTVGVEAVAFADPLDADRAQVLFPGDAVGDLVDRVVVVHRVVQGQPETALFGDPQGVAEGVRTLGEERGHLVGTLEVELRAREAHPVGVAQRLAGADAQQHVVGGGVLFPQIMRVVGGDQPEAVLVGQPHQPGVDGLLLGHAVVLHLDVEALAPEQIKIPPQGRGRGRGVAFEQPGGDFAADAGRERNQPLVALGQQVEVNAGLVVEALQPGRRVQAAEVGIPGFILREQDEVEALGVRVAGVARQAAAVGEVELAPHDRVDAGLPHRLVELDGAVHVAVVGAGHGRHAAFLHLRGQVRDAAGPVQQTVVGMDVKVDKLGTHRPPATGRAP
ncbi:MAG: hypothetical protein BWZ02_03321 [Lentisphaerae bacterium ADurb.BinA184]|nr:MAG: hypothetical protein BWZ02_03321 [Lentisphaerae bacterium ADurb.BinA184]